MEVILLFPVPQKSSLSVLNGYGPVVLTSHGSPGETALGPSQTSGDHLSGPTAFCLPPWRWSWRRHHLPASSEPTLTWTKQAALWFLQYLNTIQPTLLSEKLQNMQVDASTISWCNDHSLCGWGVVCLCRWLTAQERPWGASTLTFHLHPAYLRLPITCRHFQMILHLWVVRMDVRVVSVVDRRLSTRNWWTTLRPSVGAASSEPETQQNDKEGCAQCWILFWSL